MSCTLPPLKVARPLSVPGVGGLGTSLEWPEPQGCGDLVFLEDQEALGRGWACGCPGGGGARVSERRKEGRQTLGGREGTGPGSGAGSLICGV